MVKKSIIFSIAFFFLALSIVSGASYTSSYMNSAPNYNAYYSSSAGDNLGTRLNTYWSILDDPQQCRARQDVLLSVAPAGCTPAVVRSDLLAEQNVAVFCQVNALQINPLIQIDRIENIRFSGNKYPQGIVGAGFHPLRASLRTRDALMGDPIANNVGYVVVVLKKNSNESSLPNFVNLTLTGTLEYESGNAFGIGRYEFILGEESDSDWNINKNEQSFLRGNYFLRLERAEPDYALVSVYEGDKKLYTVRIDKGKENSDVYLPGFYCQAALKFEYVGYEAAQERARIEISDSKGSDVIDVYKGSKFMDGKCTVRDIFINSLGEGNVTVACDYNSRIVLNKIPLVSIFVEGEDVLYIEDLSKPTQTVNAKIVNVLEDGKYDITIDSKMISVSEVYRTQLLKTKTNLKDQQKQIKYSDDIENAYDKALANYIKIADDYPAEVYPTTNDGDTTRKITVAEEALVRAKDLARSLSKNQDQYEILQRLINEYSDSRSIDSYRNELSTIVNYDVGRSETLILVNNEYKTIRLLDLDLPKKASSVTFSITDSNRASNDYTAELGKETSIDRNGIKSAKLEKIDGNFAQIKFECNEKGKTGGTVSLNVDKYDSVSRTICDNSISLVYRNSDIERVAKIRVSSKASDTRTQTNLSVAIGIEKRAIKLNPDKTKERIENINESIKKWESISDSLGNVVSGMKAACFATTAALTVKNFLTGLDGKALARNKVMQDFDWTARCEKLVRDGGNGFSSVDECLLENSDDIEKEVAAYANLIETQNKEINNIIDKNDLSKENFLSGTTVNYDEVAKKYLEQNDISNIIDSTGKTKITQADYGNGSISYDQMKQLVLLDNLKNSGISGESKAKVEDKINSLSKTIIENKKSADAINSVISDNSGISDYVNVLNDKDYVKGYFTGKTSAQLGFKDDVLKDAGFDSTDQVTRVVYNGQAYLVKIGSKLQGYDNSYAGIEVAEISTDGTIKKLDSKNDPAKTILARMKFEKVDSTYYTNGYDNPEVRYYEVDPYKGVPAVTPIDKVEGWYAGIKNDVPLFTQKASVDASGAVASFWLCNVGKNKREEFSKDGFGDDVCKRFDFYTGQSLEDFPGISDKRKVSRLVSQAVENIRSAQQQYKSGLSGKGKVRLSMGDVPVGNPAVAVNGGRCQDFMSPKDCHILFNVCDPVICPNTRCNLGGEFYVQDVVQSGIVGSALLCLPNVKEPIYVPVCLSGLKAGIDGFLSVMKSHRDCLQKNLETGEMVGICDQIYSIYLCDFFWKQIAPAANVLLPKLIHYATTGGQGTRGGGEYMSVMFAWENAQKSIDYFTQSYAANSFKAFNLRSAQDVGDQFCKSFVSTKVPTKIESLLEPDSPVQFYAHFESQTLTTATFPATAQYKVYYHIYAGNDAGLYYSVYLKDPPETSYYVANPTIQVKAGFLGSGETADETIDFSAPDGYKQLCVRINDEERCGFKQVTTDFGINYISDQLVKDEITQNGITNAEQCISGAGLANGGVSATSLINTNLQGALQDSLNPAIYERGIVRVCSTENPASTTNPSRYVQVGTCDSSGKTKCWLDTQSVDRALVEGDYGTRNATLDELKTINAQYLGSDLINTDSLLRSIESVDEKVKNLIDKNDGKTNVIDLKTQVESLQREIDSIISSGDQSIVILNNQKAHLIYLKGQLNELIVKNYNQQNTDSTKTTEKSGSLNVDAPVTNTQTSTTTASDDTSKTPTSNNLDSNKLSQDKGVMIGIEYLEGRNDFMIFKWINNHVEVNTYVVKAGGGIGFSVGSPDGWRTSIDGDYNFERLDGIYQYEKDDVLDVLKSTSLNEMIIRISRISLRDQTNIYFPKNYDDPFNDFTDKSSGLSPSEIKVIVENLYN